MTTRASAFGDELRLRRSLRLCYFTRVVRTDGFVLAFTDHDRIVTFEGVQYLPAIGGGFSAERKEGGLRSGNQEARGSIDGTWVTIPDLMGNRYRGAEVFQVVTDWSRPWKVIARHRKFIRAVTWTGSQWVATLEARSQQLQRPCGGRFGGVWSARCPYELGGVYCKKDISPGTGFTGVGARVGTVVKDKWVAEFVIATWPGTVADDFYRNGAFEWIWAAPEYEDQTTALSTDNEVTRAGAGWTPNEHVNKYVRILNASGGYVQTGSSYARITSNSSDQLFYEDNAGMVGFASGSWFDICGESENAGFYSPIVGYRHSNRRVTFLLPTPKAISVGDGGLFKAGCDGLDTTCDTKFDNLINFGGSPNEPTAGAVVKPERAP